MTFSLDLDHIGLRSGKSPSPFDAINGPRLAGANGSHPLRAVSPDELVRSSDGPVSGEIVLDRPATVGEGITGTIRLESDGGVAARKAAFRLVGLRLDEVQRSESHEDSDGHTTSTDSWVETHGTLFVTDAFLEPAIPAALAPGERFETRFAIPAPRLGPPSAHLGESIIAWALEVRWDIARGGDHFVATYLPLAQHPDLIRAGVGKQGGVALMSSVSVGDATIAIGSALPAPAGTDVAISVRWPSAPGGRVARVEIHRRTNAPNGAEGIVAAAAIDPASLTGGVDVQLPLPADAAPSFDGAGLENSYVVRVLVDRRFRNDAAIERPLSVV